MDEDRVPDIQTESILPSENRRFWGINLPEHDLTWRNLISTVHDDRIYILSDARILCLHPSTGGYEVIAVFLMAALCIGAYDEWVVAGSNSLGSCFCTKVTKSGPRALPHRRRFKVARARRRARDWRHRGQGVTFAHDIPDAISAPAGPTDIFSLADLDAEARAAEEIPTADISRADRPAIRPTRSDIGSLQPDDVVQLDGAIPTFVHVDHLPARSHDHASENILIVADEAKRLIIYSLTRSDFITTIDLSIPVYCAVLSPDKTTLVAVGDCPTVFFFSVSVEPIQSTPSDDEDKSTGLKRHKWLFVPSAQIVLPLDSGSTGQDACLSTISFNHSSSLVAVGAHDGSIIILDVQAVQAAYPKDEDTEEMDLSRTMVIHDFKSSRKPSEGGAVKYIAFSPPPWDLLAWAEDRDFFGVADIRATFRRRQIVRVNPSDNSLCRVPVYETGITARDEQELGEEGEDSGQSGSNSSDRSGSNDHNTNNTNNASQPVPNDDDNNENGSGDVASGNDDDDGLDSEPDEVFGQGQLCDCSNAPRWTVTYYLYAEDREAGDVYPICDYWDYLADEEPDSRQRRALFFDRSDPEDIADWGIEHWSRDTDRIVYLARESHYQRYWRRIQSREDVAAIFWTTHSLRRTIGHFRDALEIIADPSLLRLLEERPPPMQLYLRLRRSGQLCRHGFTFGAMDVIWAWYNEPLQHRRQTRGVEDISPGTAFWDRIPHGFDRGEQMRVLSLPRYDGPSDEERLVAHLRDRRRRLQAVLRQANPRPLLERRRSDSRMRAGPSPSRPPSGVPSIVISIDQPPEEQRGSAQGQPGQAAERPRTGEHESQEPSQQVSTRRAIRQVQRYLTREGSLNRREVAWREQPSPSPLPAVRRGRTQEGVMTRGWTTDPLPEATPVVYSGSRSLSPVNTFPSLVESDTQGSTSEQRGTAGAVSTRPLDQSTTHHVGNERRHHDRHRRHRNSTGSASRFDRRQQITTPSQRPGRNRAYTIHHSPPPPLNLPQTVRNQVRGRRNSSTSAQAPLTAAPGEAPISPRPAPSPGVPVEESGEQSGSSEESLSIIEHFTEEEERGYRQQVLVDEQRERAARAEEPPPSIKLSGIGWSKAGCLYVSCEQGIFEFRVNEKDRGMFPKYSVR